MEEDALKPQPPCSIQCDGVHGFLVPALQCRSCLCLYHHQCVGVTHQQAAAQPFVCKNCQLDTSGDQESATVRTQPIDRSSPPLLPANDASPLTSPSNPGSDTSPGPPPLTPITALKPHLTTTTEEAPPLPKLQRIPRPGDVPPPPPPEQPESEPELPDLPPLIPRPRRRKFLVIPKHNFMSISPSVAVTASNVAATSVDSASLGPDLGKMEAEASSPSKPENTQTAEKMQVEEIENESKTGSEYTNEDEASSLQAAPAPAAAPPKAKKRTLKISKSSDEKEEKNSWRTIYRTCRTATIRYCTSFST
nr:unnamed protein product [Callosobruchus chinensis]